MQEPMPQTPEQRAKERLSWLTPEARSALGNRAALDLCFSKDIDMAWKVRKDGTYVVKCIKGVSPLGKAFLMVHGGASVIKGMTEEQFDALPGRSDLCLSEELPPDPEMDDFHIKPADKARLHPFYAGLKVNPTHGFDDQGRPIYVYHLDAKYAHLPREDEADIDARVIVQDNLVVGVQAVTQRGGFILDGMATRLEDGETLLGCKFKGLFENIAVWSEGLRLAVTDMS